MEFILHPLTLGVMFFAVFWYLVGVVAPKMDRKYTKFGRDGPGLPGAPETKPTSADKELLFLFLRVGCICVGVVLVLFLIVTALLIVWKLIIFAWS